MALGLVAGGFSSCKTSSPSDPAENAPALVAAHPDDGHAAASASFPRSDSDRPELPSAALALQLASPRPQVPARSPAKVSAAPDRSESATSAAFDSSRDAGETLRVRTTAYHRDEADHFSFGSMSAMGTVLKARGPVRSAAADWSRFPAGTRFRIAGDLFTYVIDDYGSALVGTGTIDLFQTDDFAMDRWGARHVDIEILDWGSPEKSLAILKSRTGHRHVDQMIAALERSTATIETGR